MDKATLDKRIDAVIANAKCTHGAIPPHYICRDCADAIREAAHSCDHTSETESTWKSMASSIDTTMRRLRITAR